jgi:hypothetical protein
MVDRNGNRLNIGDRVSFESYEFTIEEVNIDWVWGSNLPEDNRYCTNGNKNFHNPNFLELIKPKNKWGNSKIEFKFI